MLCPANFLPLPIHPLNSPSRSLWRRLLSGAYVRTDRIHSLFTFPSKKSNILLLMIWLWYYYEIYFTPLNFPFLVYFRELSFRPDCLSMMFGFLFSQAFRSKLLYVFLPTNQNNIYIFFIFIFQTTFILSCLILLLISLYYHVICESKMF